MERVAAVHKEQAQCTGMLKIVRKVVTVHRGLARSFKVSFGNANFEGVINDLLAEILAGRRTC